MLTKQTTLLGEALLEEAGKGTQESQAKGLQAQVSW